MSNDMSARPCGCDPGANHRCEWHAVDYTNKTFWQEYVRRNMASRENNGTGKANVGVDKRTGAGNGAQQGYATGATRSTNEGKIDFEGHIHPEVLAVFGEYMHRHRIQRDGKLRASDNWQNGIPVYRYMKSLLRHTMELWRAWRGFKVVNPDSGQHFTLGDLLCAIMFNTMGMIYEMLSREARIVTRPTLSQTFVTVEQRRRLETEDQPVDWAKQPRDEAELAPSANAGNTCCCGTPECCNSAACAEVRRYQNRLNAVKDVAVEREKVVGRREPVTRKPIYDQTVSDKDIGALGLAPGNYRLTIAKD